MIRAIVFDMGGVIMDYDPPLFTRRFVRDPEDARLLEDLIFHSEEWVRLDAGTIELEEFDRILQEKVPDRLKEVTHTLLYHWHENLPVFAGMERLMKLLHEKGYALYLLSNAGQQFHIYSEKIPAFQYLNGIVLSSDLQLMKPDAEIFEYLLDTYQLEPDECLFIDDSAANVKGAEAVGLRGYTYDDGNLYRLIKQLDAWDIISEEEAGITL